MTLERRRTDESLLNRSGPLADLSRMSDDMTQMLDQAFRFWPRSLQGERGAFTPPADVEETDDAYVVEVELPGVSREDVTVEAQGRRLTVQGERKERERAGIFRTKTRVTGRFYLEVILPTDIDPEKVSASLKDGVLTVRIDKSEKEQAKTRKIPVR